MTTILPRSLATALLCLVLSGCALVRREPGPCARPPCCTLEVSPQAVEGAPGETVQLTPVMRTYGVSPLPAECPATWSVDGTKATVDRTGRLTISPDAAPGDTFRVHVRAVGQTASRVAKVADPAPNPIAGAWRQRETGCVGVGGYIGELIFQRGGEYRSTQRPFETQAGLLSGYSYDAATGTLVLGSGQGRAGVENGILWIEGFNEFGFNPATGQHCRATFDRIPVPHI